jgi:hypothetical protein
VAACKWLSQTIAQLPNGTVGNPGNQDELALMGAQAVAHDAVCPCGGSGCHASQYASQVPLNARPRGWPRCRY